MVYTSRTLEVASVAIAQPVGYERVRGLPWARQLETATGGLLLAATEEPLDPQVPAHAARLNEFSNALHLRALQERHRYPE